MAEIMTEELAWKVMETLLKPEIREVRFPLDNRRALGILKLENDYQNEGAVYLITAAVAEGDDHLVQHYYHHEDSMEQMEEWLKNEDNIPGIIKSLTELNERVKDGFD